jgi:hypothetical protein
MTTIYASEKGRSAMWEYEHTVETTASPETIWGHYADVANWGTWDASVQKIEMHGPFAEGTDITLRPAGQDPVTFKIAELRDRELFVDEAALPGATLRFIHRLAPTAAGTRITHRVEIDGPAAGEFGPGLGPAVTADIPEAMAGLVKLAES